jgi:LysM repeat protein
MSNPKLSPIGKTSGSIKITVTFLVLALFISPALAKASIVDSALLKIKSMFTSSTPKNPVNTRSEGEDVLIAYSGSLLEKTGTDTQVIGEYGEEILTSSVGMLRTSADDEHVENDAIAVYEVKNGDTIADVAKLFNVSKSTIIWANDIKGNKLTPGDILIILPVTGVKHTVKKGDTIASIVKKYKGNKEDFLEFNDLTEGSELAIGETLIVPDGEIAVDSPVTKKITTKKKTYVKSETAGYYARPLVGGIKTQGIHGHNAVDIATKVGSSLLASAAGTVQVAKSSGYNGGYGAMIIISHPNGTQTVYGHLSAVYVTPGQTVSQGEVIGLTGNSGKSTGPHLHFEIRGAYNPF